MRLSDETLYKGMIGQELIVRLPPVSEVTIVGRLASITKATPRVVEPEDIK